MNMLPLQKGFAALYVMLIVASITAAVTLGITNSMLVTTRQAILTQAGAEARALAMRCAETLLMQVRNSPSSSSSGTLVTIGGSCAYSISGSDPTKTVSVTATHKNVYKRITIVTSAIFPVIVARWTEGA